MDELKCLSILNRRYMKSLLMHSFTVTIRKSVAKSILIFLMIDLKYNSMTPLEREKPEIIDAKRRERLAKGSGTTMAEVNKLMKQFEDTRKMMKAVAGGNMKMPKLPGRGFRR